MSDNLDMLLNIDLSDTEIPPEDKIMFEMLLKIHLLEIIKYETLTDQNLNNIKQIVKITGPISDPYEFMLYDREKIKEFKDWVQGQQLTERYLHGKTVNGNPIPHPFVLIDKRYYLPPGSNWGDERVWNVNIDDKEDGILTIADGRHLLPFRVIKQSVGKEPSVVWHPPVAFYNAGVAAVSSWRTTLPPPLDAKVVQDYIKEEGGRGLTISVNDDVVVTYRFKNGWWRGYIKGKEKDVGLFPASHVHLVEGSIAKTGGGYLKLELVLSIPDNVKRIISQSDAAPEPATPAAEPQPPAAQFVSPGNIQAMSSSKRDMVKPRRSTRSSSVPETSSTQSRINFFEQLGKENAGKAGRKNIRPPATAGSKKKSKKKKSKRKSKRKKSKRRSKRR